MTDIVAMLRDRADCARNEKNGTAEIDAIHFDTAADEIERLRDIVVRQMAGFKEIKE